MKSPSLCQGLFETDLREVYLSYWNERNVNFKLPGGYFELWFTLTSHTHLFSMLTLVCVLTHFVSYISSWRGGPLYLHVRDDKTVVC